MPYRIHKISDRPSPSNKKSHPTQISPNYLSKQFAIARDKTELFDDILATEHPSSHEIRSLGIKLYEDNGYGAQKLAGHTERKMTELYKAGYDITLTNAEANLEIQI